MSNFFSVDSGLYKFMSRLFDMVKLNAMWILCSIPIVTMGAATTAAFSITLKMVDDEEGYIAGPFLKSFKQNLKKGSLIGIIQLVAMYAIYLDFQFYGATVKTGGSGTLFLVIGFIAMFMTVMHCLYAYALLARYENTVINTLRNSYSIAIKYLPKTIFLVVTLLVEYAIFFWIHPTLWFFGFILGPACFILTISGFARQFFRNIERENTLQEEEGKSKLAAERNNAWKEAFGVDSKKEEK